MMAKPPETVGPFCLKAEHSAMLAIVGGVIDLIAGYALLQSVPPMMPITVPLGETTMPTTMPIGTSAIAVSYFLLALGVIVLVTGVYMFYAKMLMHRSRLGWLMIVYGVIMLVIGIGMIGNVFSMMMQGSAISGAVMLVVGVAMLYSGSSMAKK
jgi:uncharacterized membrane protein HdeD (DUF308 family)